MASSPEGVGGGEVLVAVSVGVAVSVAVGVMVLVGVGVGVRVWVAVGGISVSVAVSVAVGSKEVREASRVTAGDFISLFDTVDEHALADRINDTRIRPIIHLPGLMEHIRL